MVYNKGSFYDVDKNGKPKKFKKEDELIKLGYSIEEIHKVKTCMKIQRWVNNRIIFNSCERFEDYDGVR